MRIISDFHDYYDIGMQNGIDPQLPYRRFRQEEPIRFPKDDRQSWGTFERSSYSYSKSYRFLYIGFAGKIYPRMEGWFGKYQLEEETPYYTIEPSFGVDPTLLEDVFFVIAKEHWRRSGEKYLKRSAKRIKEEVFQCFEFKDAPELLDLFEKFKTAIFVYKLGDNTIILNERLNLYNFQKVLPPMEAFQELAMYVGARLTKPVIQEPPLSDKVKAEIHGFDKYSFRKGKTK